MEIDNYEEAIALLDKLRKALPFRVRPRKQLLKGVDMSSITEKSWVEVDSAFYSGDTGGILVGLGENIHQGQNFVVSLTHVEFDPEHELASEVKAYQKHRSHNRSHKLMLQDRGGFASLAAKKTSKRHATSKGFR